MTENIAPEATESEDWLDNWLDSAKRTVRSVTLYAANDVLAEIDELEAQLRVAQSASREGLGERSYGESDPTADLQAKIDARYLELDQSKRVFRISFLSADEIETIREATINDLKAQLDKVSADSRKLAQDQAKRENITNPADLNAFVRGTARAAASKVLEREVSIRTIAEAIVSPKMTQDNVRRLYDKLGDSQVALLSQAYSKAANEAPRVTVPKSQKP